MSYLIEEYSQHLRAAGRSRHTIRAYVGVLRRLHNDLPHGLAYATSAQIEAWLARASHTAPSAWSAVAYTRAVRRFFAWADGRLLAGDPAALLARPRYPADRPRPVTEAELRRALELASPWWRVAILLGALAGLRASEMAALRRSDVTAEVIYIARGKGGDPATVPTHPQLHELAQQHPDEWLLQPARRPAPIPDLSARASQYFDRLGMPSVTLHRFRHYFACALLRQGVDLRTLQTLMRHHSIRTTQAYLLVVDEDRTAAIRRLPSL